MKFKNSWDQINTQKKLQTEISKALITLIMHYEAKVLHNNHKEIVSISLYFFKY